jgi:uncharacterized protein
MTGKLVTGDLGSGVGLKPRHYSAIAALEEAARASGPVRWFEAISENYMDSHGAPRHHLERIRRDYPVALHGVSMSLGSADGVPADYLRSLAELVDRIEPALVSDHLCFSRAGRHYSHDLLPLPMNEATADVVAANIQRVQERLGRQILVENISSYVRTKQDEIPEPDFVSRIVLQAGCGLLLDVNNILVNAFNHGFDPRAYVDAMPLPQVHEIHVAGHSKREDFLFDDHVGPTPEGVWDLYAYALGKIGRPVSTLVEWDTDIPAFAVLAQEAARATDITRTVFGGRA